jgi:hypothetical protein
MKAALVSSRADLRHLLRGVKLRFKRSVSFGTAMQISVVAALVLAFVPSLVEAAAPPGPFFQGFEKNTNGWIDSTTPGFDGTITRVPSGYPDSGYAVGVASAAGKFHARISGDTCDRTQFGFPCYSVFTRWGGYSSTFPEGGYKTQADIYLDVTWATTHPDYRFDWDSSINDNAGNFLQDYVFNAGTSPAGDGFFVNASTNATRSGAYPENPCPDPSTTPNTCRTPVLITQSGWYTFRHTFTNQGGSLQVDFDIFPLGSSVAIAHWTIVPGHAISSVGGNRYGWFVIDEIPSLAIDNTLRTGLCHVQDGEGDMDGKDSGKAHVHSHAQSCEGQNNQQGDVEESDPGSGTDFHSTSVSSATFTADEGSQTVTMVGTGLDNGLPVAFTMVTADNGPAGPGVYSLVLSDGYTITNALTSGSLATQ